MPKRLTQPEIQLAVQNTRLFAAVPPEMLGPVLQAVVQKNFAARQVIFSQDDPCNGFYLLLQGAVKLFKISPDGREHILHIIEPGETFAEAAMFSGGTFPANAESIRPCSLLLFRKEPFISVVESDPKLAVKLLGGMSMWLRRLVDQVEALALKDAGARLAKHLLEARKENTVRLKAPKAAVASHLAMSPETLSRLFLRMETRGILQVEGATIHILNPTALESLSSGDSL